MLILEIFLFKSVWLYFSTNICKVTNISKQNKVLTIIFLLQDAIWTTWVGREWVDLWKE